MTSINSAFITWLNVYQNNLFSFVFRFDRSQKINYSISFCVKRDIFCKCFFFFQKLKIMIKIENKILFLSQNA